MVQNVYPLFGRGRILKKEFLQSMRDYSYGFIRLEYQKYSNGILEGCDISVSEQEISIGPGIVKYGDFIYLITEAQAIPYTHTGRLQCLKLQLHWKRVSEDYLNYTAELALDETPELAEGEVEVCHFKLKEGFRLRDQYVDFYDIETEFDTVNLTGATWSGIGKTTLSPVITELFAKEAKKCALQNPWDIQFCGMCMNTTKALRREVIEDYVRARLDLPGEERLDNEKLFEYMEMILRNIRQGTELRPERKIKRRHTVYVD